MKTLINQVISKTKSAIIYAAVNNPPSEKAVAEYLKDQSRYNVNKDKAILDVYDRFGQCALIAYILGSKKGAQVTAITGLAIVASHHLKDAHIKLYVAHKPTDE